MKDYILIFFENLSKKFNFHENRTRITSTLQENRWTFLIICRPVLLRMRNVLDKHCKDNRNTHFTLNKFFLATENRAVCERKWKYIVDRGRPQMKVWCMRIARCLPNATNTHSEYIIIIIIIAFPLQLLWMLRYTHISCLGIYNIQDNKFPLRRNHSYTFTKFSLLVFTLDIVAVYSDKYHTSTHFWNETQVLWPINTWYI